MEADKEAKSDPNETRQNMSESNEESSGSLKVPQQASSYSEFEERSVHLSEKSSVVITKENFVNEEILAVHLTTGQDGPRPRRRLMDFILHDVNRIQQPFEVLKSNNVFISGTIFPWGGSSDIEKENGIRCKHIGHVKSWAISGYEEGYPVISLSTDIADYVCVQPSSSYRDFYETFYEKVRSLVELFMELSRYSEGNCYLSRDELGAVISGSLRCSKNFSGWASMKDFIFSQGDFIYNQLIALNNKRPEKDDQIFKELPMLPTHRDRSWKREAFMRATRFSSSWILKIGDEGEIMDQPSSSTCAAEEDENVKLAGRLEEHRQSMKQHSMKQNKSQHLAPASNKFYVKIHEDEIANDYPPPTYYKMFIQEMDEYSVCHPNKLSGNTLHNWSLYNLDSRLISLELLPMKPVAEIEVTIYGSGFMTAGGGSGFRLNAGPNQLSSSASGAQNVDGIPIYLSTIKEWMIEYESSMVFTSIRTDMAWYRLGKPSKQYSPWYEPVLKTARLAISIITLLKDHCWISQLSFEDVIKRVSEFVVDHPAYISSTLVEVKRYILVHGQIILQLFAEYPNEMIRGCAFLTSLSKNMEERHHTKWVVKKKEMNYNPRTAEVPVVSKRKAMQATTTRLIKKIWGEYYSNYYPEYSTEGDSCQLKEDEEVEHEQVDNEEENDEEEKLLVPEKPKKTHSLSWSTSKEIRWDGEAIGKTCSGAALYKRAIVQGDVIAVKGALVVEVDDSEETPAIYFVEYMFENSDGRKMIHGREMQRGTQTILGNAANEREIFLTNECMDFELGNVKQTVVLDIRLMPWGYQHRKYNANSNDIDRARADDRKRKGLPIEYYCKSLYWPERGAFFSLPFDSMGLGSGFCHSCKIKETHREIFKVNSSNTGFTYKGSEFYVHDFVYVSPLPLAVDREDHATFRDGQDVGLKTYVVCHLLEIDTPKEPKPESTQVKVRRFFRPEDISAEKGYSSDIREVYYSEQILNVLVETIRGKCEVRKKLDLPSLGGLAIYEHIFFCENLYDPAKGAIGQLPDHVRLGSSTGRVIDYAASSKEKCEKGENDSEVLDEQRDSFQEKKRLATLDIFAGCGGLAQGLQQTGISITKWAIESELSAGDAFCLNNSHSIMFPNNCNVILRTIMEVCGDADDCISTSEAVELVARLGENEINSLPMPGQVDFINGGTPCQGFSEMNRFNQNTWSKVQCELILAFLSFADYFRPKFLLLESATNFVTFNKGQMFHLTIASLLHMGYQVRFGILEAGAYGVSQSRKRAFLWAASPEETLPEWPEPMYAFAGPELKITLPGNVQYAAVRSTASGAPFRAVTVRDTIGDLPAVGNRGFDRNLAYKYKPVSWFQKVIRGDMLFLPDHIPKEMNELNFIQCQRIPKRAGADWHDLPDKKVRLSTGQVVDILPWYLPNTANRNNQWKGLFGRLDWEGNFPSIADPQLMGKVGMWFHPEQDRIVTVRECARSLGFFDSFRFSGTIDDMYRQIGDAVPPPLAFALGRKLKEAVYRKRST